MEAFSHLGQYPPDLSEREMFQIKVVEKIKTCVSYSVTFFPKIVPFIK
jgi:hypothetical protein